MFPSAFPSLEGMERRRSCCSTAGPWSGHRGEVTVASGRQPDSMVWRPAPLTTPRLPPPHPQESNPRKGAEGMLSLPLPCWIGESSQQAAPCCPAEHLASSPSHAGSKGSSPGSRGKSYQLPFCSRSGRCSLNQWDS